MKKWVSIFLLGLMLYNIMGYYVAYLAMLQELKNEMRSSIHNADQDENITIIKLPYIDGKIADNDLEFVDEDEFSYRGQMYDVQRTEINGNEISFYCLCDENENTLNFSLEKHIDCNNLDGNSAEKKNESITKSLLKEYLPQMGLIVPIGENSIVAEFSNLAYPTLNASYEVALPPPKTS